MRISKKLIAIMVCCLSLVFMLTGCSLFACKHEETVVQNQVSATCASAGYTGDTVCVKCNEVVTAGQTIAATEHQTSLQNVKEATCTEDGYTGDQICDVCGVTITPGETVEVLGHDGERINEKEPTCMEPGYSGDMQCKLCEEIYEKGLVMDIVDHDWQEIEVQKEATCKQEGQHTVECRFCKTTMDEKVEKLEHSIVTDPSVEATCTTAGKTEGKHCATCKQVIEAQKTIPALGHDVVTTSQGTAATCTKDGKESVSRCQRCNKQLTNGETIKATGHKEVKTEGVAATCTADGKSEGSTCSVCKTVIKQSETISKTGHTPVSIENKAATCTTDGSTGGTKCSKCGTVITQAQTIKATGHQTSVKNKKDATCTAKGYTGDEVCAVCNVTVKSGQDIAMLEHELRDDEDTAIEVTCEENGRTADKVCKLCKEVIEEGEDVPALGHGWKVMPGTRVAATCTEAGHEDNSKCARCEEEKEGETIAKIPHTKELDESSVVEATCQKSGKEANLICSICKKVLKKGKTIAIKECEAVDADDAVAPTCSTVGKTATKVCKWCGKTLEEGVEIPMIDHTPAERDAKESTCTVPGKTAEIYCSECKTVIEAAKELPLAEHKPIPAGEDVEPTCTTEGIKYGTKCSECGETLTEDTPVEKLPHEYSDKRVLRITLDSKNDYNTAYTQVQCGNCEHYAEFDGVVSNKVESVKATCLAEGKMTCTVTIKINDDQSIVVNDVECNIGLGNHVLKTENAKLPTCTEEGTTMSQVCEVCQTVEKESETLQPICWQNLTNVKIDWDTEKNSDGYICTITAHCTTCDKEVSYRGKVWETPEEKQDPTCTEDGYQKVVLAINYLVDGEPLLTFEAERPLAAKKHIVSKFPEYDAETIPQYNLATGEVYDTFTCDECKEEIRYVYEGSVKVTAEPSCDRKGSLFIKWALKDDIRVDGPYHNGTYTGYELDTLGHKYTGENTDICAVCGSHKALAPFYEGLSWFRTEELGDESISELLITKLIIQKEEPKEDTYQLAWNADQDDMGYIRAYWLNDGTTLVLSTMGDEKLYLNRDGHFLEEFVNLETIEGLDMVSIDNCDVLVSTFKNCEKLSEIDITAWTTSKKQIALSDTFTNCVSLVTIKSTKAFVEKIGTDNSELKQSSVFDDCRLISGKNNGTTHYYDKDDITMHAAAKYFSY